LLAEFTAPYAASIKQQFVLLFYGVASGNVHLPEIGEGSVIQRHGLFRLFPGASVRQRRKAVWQIPCSDRLLNFY
jgi:hypothetical protein